MAAALALVTDKGTAVAEAERHLATIREHVGAAVMPHVRLAAEWAEQRAELRQATKDHPAYTDRGIEEIERIARERGISDLREAAPLLDVFHPTPTPMQSSAGLVSTPDGPMMPGTAALPQSSSDDPELAALILGKGEDAGALGSLIAKALSDTRAQSRGNRR